MGHTLPRAPRLVGRTACLLALTGLTAITSAAGAAADQRSAHPQRGQCQPRTRRLRRRRGPRGPRGSVAATLCRCPFRAAAQYADGWASCHGHRIRDSGPIIPCGTLDTSERPSPRNDAGVLLTILDTQHR